MKTKYKKMLDRMQEKESSSRRRVKKEPWFLYILECNDGSLYTGITKDIKRRLKEHSDGRASRFTRTRRPVKLLYHEPCAGRTKALVRECRVKAFNKKRKLTLIQEGA